jgi:hypothetical protein
MHVQQVAVLENTLEQYCDANPAATAGRAFAAMVMELQKRPRRKVPIGRWAFVEIDGKLHALATSFYSLVSCNAGPRIEAR